MKPYTAALLVALLGSCAQLPPEPNLVYLVSSHDAKTGSWVVERINTVDHSRVKYVLECSFYRWASKEPVKSPEACDLLVGERLVPNPFPKKSEEFLDIFQLGSDTLVITRGRDADRTSEQFSVKSATVVPYAPGT